MFRVPILRVDPLLAPNPSGGSALEVFTGFLLRDVISVTLKGIYSKSYGFLIMATEFKSLNKNPVWGVCVCGGIS